MPGVCEVDTFSATDELHRLREELAEAQGRLRQVERHAVIGQTLKEFFHEARNELAVLKNGLNLLPQILDDSKEAKDIVGLLKERGERLHRLLEDVRETTAPIGLSRDLCDVSQVWRKAWLSLESEWKERDVSFEEDVGDIDVVLPIDAFRIEQVFRNLFQNSLEASADPVAIHICCFQQHDDNQFISIAVCDNGPGLTLAQQQRLFVESFTSKPKGSGLGLSIVKRIVEAHGGRISLADRGFRGVKFVIHLPVADG